MARIVTTQYRYKRPPKRKEPVALKVGQIAQADDRPSASTDPPAEVSAPTKPVIVTAKRKPGRFGKAEELTSEEHHRRGDAADALFRELVRRATGKA